MRNEIALARNALSSALDLRGVDDELAREDMREAQTYALLAIAEGLHRIVDKPPNPVDGCTCGNPDLPVFDHHRSCLRRTA